MGKLLSGLAKVETKVWTAGAGAVSGGTLSALIVWLIGVAIAGCPFDAAHAQLAVAAVPGVVSAAVSACVAAAGAVAGGWLAPHSSRPDLAPEAQSVVNRAG